MGSSNQNMLPNLPSISDYWQFQPIFYSSEGLKIARKTPSINLTKFGFILNRSPFWFHGKQFVPAYIEPDLCDDVFVFFMGKKLAYF